MVVLLVGCDGGPHPTVSTERLTSQSIHYADPEKQKAFKAALKDAGISSEASVREEGREYIEWKGEHAEAVVRIKVQLFGEPLPEGRYAHFNEPHHAEFKKWLRHSKISFRLQQSDGREYVV